MSSAEGSAGSSAEGLPVVPDRLFFRIRDVAKLAGVKPYVLRYWESEFPAIAPSKSPAGHRVYRRTDVETILLIKHLLYTERFSIEGARKRLADLRKERALSEAKAQVSGRAASGAAVEAARTGVKELRAFVRSVKMSDLFAWG